MHPLDLSEVPEMAEVPAWRELWYGSLEALHIHREPTINNTQEDVLVQLGAVAFLHCPVRNLGERGVGTFFLSTCYKLFCRLHFFANRCLKLLDVPSKHRIIS